MMKDCFIRHLDTSNSEEEEFCKPSKQVNQYQIIEEIGCGSFAKVYLARDVETGKLYAMKQFKLKTLQRKENGLSQLEREIQSMRRFNHPNIMRLHEVLHVEETDVVYLVLEYADCGSLQKMILLKSLSTMCKDNERDQQWIKYVFMKVLDAVFYLHKQGVVHQDIKPSNILVNLDGNVYLSDFGAGHSFGSAEMVVGSPGYQAPEAIADLDDVEEANPAEEDVWSLGVTLFQSFFGYLPFEGESMYEIIKDIKSSPLRIPNEGELDPEFVILLKGMLQVDPSKRMTIDNVISSPFFNGTPKTMKIDNFINKTFTNEIRKDNDSSKMVTIIKAKVCDKNYSFVRQSLTSCNLIRMLSVVGTTTNKTNNSLLQVLA